MQRQKEMGEKDAFDLKNFIVERSQKTAGHKKKGNCIWYSGRKNHLY